MNELTKVFNYGSSNVRTIIKDGNPWFVAKDVCEILELTNTTVALERLDADERSKFNLGRQGETNIISEAGLYQLIFQSRKPEARQFKRWITHEVIPQIRQTGGYVPVSQEDDDSTIMAKALLIAQTTIDKKNEIIEQQRQALEVQAPRVNGYERLISVNGLYTMAEAAQLLSNGLTKPIGQNRLYKMLKKWKAIKSDNSPYQHMIDRGLMNVKTTIYIDGDGVEHVKNKSMVTPKGLEYIRKRLLELQEIEKIAGEELF